MFIGTGVNSTNFHRLLAGNKHGKNAETSKAGAVEKGVEQPAVKLAESSKAAGSRKRDALEVDPAPSAKKRKTKRSGKEVGAVVIDLVQDPDPVATPAPSPPTRKTSAKGNGKGKATSAPTIVSSDEEEAAVATPARQTAPVINPHPENAPAPDNEPAEVAIPENGMIQMDVEIPEGNGDYVGWRAPDVDTYKIGKETTLTCRAAFSEFGEMNPKAFLPFMKAVNLSPGGFRAADKKSLAHRMLLCLAEDPRSVEQRRKMMLHGSVVDGIPAEDLPRVPQDVPVGSSNPPFLTAGRPDPGSCGFYITTPPPEGMSIVNPIVHLINPTYKGNRKTTEKNVVEAMLHAKYGKLSFQFFEFPRILKKKTRV